MAIYEGFASVYDLFMEETPYGVWAGQICGLLEGQGIRDGLVCELGCGTGQMTRRLAAAGFDMIGIDASEEMLSVAREAPSEGILYLCQDMTEMELYGTVRAIVAVCDTMNYLPDEAAWRQTLALADNYLDPGGIFLFDLRTEAYYRDLGDETLTDSLPEGSYIWENEADPTTRTNRYTLELYVREDVAAGGSDQVYRRFLEEHETHWWSIEEIQSWVEAAGLIWCGALDADTLQPADANSRRIYVSCKECKKKFE